MQKSEGNFLLHFSYSSAFNFEIVHCFEDDFAYMKIWQTWLTKAFPDICVSYWNKNFKIVRRDKEYRSYGACLSRTKLALLFVSIRYGPLNLTGNNP